MSPPHSTPHAREDSRQNAFGRDRDRNGSKVQVVGQIGISSNGVNKMNVNGERQALYYSVDPVVRDSAASR